MPEVTLNYLAILVTAIINMVLGSIWWAPGVFGKPWMALTGFTPEKMAAAKQEKGKMARNYIVMFIGALVMAYVLSHFLTYAGAVSFTDGMLVAFWAWLGFIAVASLGDYMFSGRPIKLFAINYAYHLVSLLIMGGLLTVWQ